MWIAWFALAEAKAPDACWVPNRLQYTGRDTLVYTPLTEAQQREADAAKLERRDPRDVRAGWLALEVNRVTLAAADPAHQLIVVLQDGQEVHRFQPESEIPDTNPEVYGFWYAYAVVQLPEGLEPPFDVEVTDRLLSAKCTWTVDATGVATRKTDKRKDEGEDDQSSM
ncbi:MAG: hypothetical protein ABMA64_40340 [Myxococcota bacterium]